MYEISLLNRLFSLINKIIGFGLIVCYDSLIIVIVNNAIFITVISNTNIMFLIIFHLQNRIIEWMLIMIRLKRYDRLLFMA